MSPDRISDKVTISPAVIELSVVDADRSHSTYGIELRDLADATETATVIQLTVSRHYRIEEVLTIVDSTEARIASTILPVPFVTNLKWPREGYRVRISNLLNRYYAGFEGYFRTDHLDIYKSGEFGMVVFGRASNKQILSQTDNIPLGRRRAEFQQELQKQLEGQPKLPHAACLLSSLDGLPVEAYRIDDSFSTSYETAEIFLIRLAKEEASTIAKNIKSGKARNLGTMWATTVRGAPRLITAKVIGSDVVIREKPTSLGKALYRCSDQESVVLTLELDPKPGWTPVVLNNQKVGWVLTESVSPTGGEYRRRPSGILQPSKAPTDGASSF